MTRARVHIAQDRDSLRAKRHDVRPVHLHSRSGTEELSKNAVTALEGRQACLLAQHGMIVVGQSLGKAMWLSVEVETLATKYHGAIQVGTPHPLSKEEIERVIVKMSQLAH